MLQFASFRLITTIPKEPYVSRKPLCISVVLSLHVWPRVKLVGQETHRSLQILGSGQRPQARKRRVLWPQPPSPSPALLLHLRKVRGPGFSRVVASQPCSPVQVSQVRDAWPPPWFTTNSTWWFRGQFHEFLQKLKEKESIIRPISQVDRDFGSSLVNLEPGLDLMPMS